FAAEIASVKALAAYSGLALVPDDARIAAHAATGIATLAELRAKFDETAAKVLRSRVIPDGVGGWFARSLDRIASLITVRRVDGLVEGDTPSAILARAGFHLNAGNLAACVTEMEALKGPAADAAQLWLEEARTRVAAEAAVNDASLKAIAALSAGSAPTKAP